MQDEPGDEIPPVPRTVLWYLARGAARRLSRKRAASPPEEPVRTPCCGALVTGGPQGAGWPVVFNPYSRVVSCHACGMTFAPMREGEPVEPALFPVDRH